MKYQEIINDFENLDLSTVDTKELNSIHKDLHNNYKDAELTVEIRIDSVVGKIQDELSKRYYSRKNK